MKGNVGYPRYKGEKGVAGPQGPPGPHDLTTTTPTTEAPTTVVTTDTPTMPATTPGQCGGSGWRRVVFLNMTDPSHFCPSGLRLTSCSRGTCGRANSTRNTCWSTTFSVCGSQYSRVCGRAQAHWWGYNYAFYGYHSGHQGIDGSYLDGLSLTHGASGARQHIWTFASGLFVGRPSSYSGRLQCPCNNGNTYRHLLLWAMTIFVRVLQHPVIGIGSIPMPFSGMARFVRVVAAAASSTILHGSPRT